MSKSVKGQRSTDDSGKEAAESVAKEGPPRRSQQEEPTHLNSLALQLQVKEAIIIMAQVAPSYPNGGIGGGNAAAGAGSGLNRKKLTGYVGFANLPNQVHRKSVRKGFNFTAMVVGKSCSFEGLDEGKRRKRGEVHCGWDAL